MMKHKFKKGDKVVFDFSQKDGVAGEALRFITRVQSRQGYCVISRVDKRDGAIRLEGWSSRGAFRMLDKWRLHVDNSLPEELFQI